MIFVQFSSNNGENALSDYFSPKKTATKQKNMKNFKFFPKNEPGLVLNLFLIFGENPGSSSYKLGSY